MTAEFQNNEIKMFGKMQIKRLLLIIFAIIFISCSESVEKQEIDFVTTIHPVGEILAKITGDPANIRVLLAPGTSPHTYAPKPSDMKMIRNSKALIYVSPFLDEWAAEIDAPEKITLIDLLPDSMKIDFDHNHGHSHGDNESVTDPHFWTDPLAVKAVADKLTNILVELDPAMKEEYHKNYLEFSRELDSLNRKVLEITSGIRGKDVVLFHPSFLYFLKRYGLKYLAAVEESPGKEPGPKFIARLSRKIKSAGVKAIFTEPQLPVEAVRAIAGAAGTKIYELDPIGGRDSLNSYDEIILYNARTFKRALQ